MEKEKHQKALEKLREMDREKRSKKFRKKLKEFFLAWFGL